VSSPNHLVRRALLLGFAAWSTTHVAVAETAKGARPETEPVERPIDARTKRETPDYDGRGEEATTAGDTLLWVPRVLFAPLYFTSEYLVRRPVGWVVSKAEHARIHKKLEYVFTFGRKQHDIGLIPTWLVDFGKTSSAGAYFFWDDFLFDQNYLRARAATGGKRWLLLSLADRIEWGGRHELTFRGEYGSRPDHTFYGLGPATDDDDEGWFALRHVEAGARYTGELVQSSRIAAFTTWRNVEFDTTPGGERPHLATAIQAGRYPAPPGLAAGYGVLVSGLELTLDSRAPLPQDPAPASDWVSPSESGVRLQLRAKQGSDVRAPRRREDGSIGRHHWIEYGVSAGAFFEMTGRKRVLGISFVADFADPLGARASVPFTEQVSLGGARPMRGFRQGRLVDRSALVVLAEYRWPVWVWVDGVLHYGVGNVFGRQLEAFRAPMLRQSFGLGLRANSSRDHAVEALIAFGTRTFEAGAGVESVRALLGASSGF
jgi:hypothetical protein